MEPTKLTHQKRTQRDYTLGFKLSVVEQVEKGDLTYKQAQNRYGIQGRSTVLTWLRKHGRLDWSSSGHLVMTKSTETPEQKIKRLERTLQDANDRNYLKDEMLKMIDQQCGTSYRKKYFASLPDRLKPKGS